MNVRSISPAAVLRIALLAMGALMWQGVAAQSAVASCGDWLAGHETANDGTEDTGLSLTALRDGIAGMSDPEAASNEAPAPRPCSGPNCRRIPQVPDAPLAPTSTTRLIVPQWLLNSPLTTLQELPALNRAPVEPAANALAADPSRIERPPRSC